MNTTLYEPKRTNPAGIKPANDREVPAALGKIQFSLDQLDAAVKALRERLDPVVRPQPGSPALEAPASNTSASLAVALEQVAERILDYQRKISGLEETIQL
jgi:Flp pilus assembly protein TadD